MKCEIIRDLLPLYLDGLTSKESNTEIEAHMKDCAPCSEILQQMQKEMEIKEEPKKRKFNPFRKFNRRMKTAVAAAVAICICLGGLGYQAFGRGFSIDPNEISMDVHLDGDTLWLDFALEKGNLMHYGTMFEDSVASFHLRRVWALPGDYLGTEPNRFSWGMDLNLLTLDAGERLEVQMTDGSLAVVDTSEEEGMMIQNGNAGPVSIMMIQEGEETTSVTIDKLAEKALEECTITIDYGRETRSYSLTELLELAE